ncbi:UNVERIFIED_CONTAM: hypothetical protein GTU68_013612, partial [Idotea baltica]|nr:hypothetical protein [Idotea baltica]
MNQGRISWGARGVILIPMIWLLVFFLMPFLFLFVLSFSVPAIARPPYEPVIFFEDGRIQFQILLESWQRILTNSTYISTYISSVGIAFAAMSLTLIIGFPMAYVVARSGEKYRNFLLVLVILPFWTSFLLRVYALKTIFYNQGPVNSFLMSTGIVSEPIQFLNTNFMVLVGITYVYLPFMILPLYANLVKLPEEVLEASQDLGASSFTTFWNITVPLALPGIIAGCLLVFIPAVGEYVVPDLL